MKKLPATIAIIATGLSVAILFGIGLNQLSKAASRATIQETDIAIKLGIESAREGIPAEANPYTWQYKRVAWLRGWMAAKNSIELKDEK